MKLSLIFTILLFSNILDANGSEYSLIIDKPFNNELLSIDQDNDRTISAVGFIKKHKADSSPSIAYTNPFDYLESVSSRYGTKMQLIKADAGANIIIDKSISISKLSKAVSLVKTPNNGYFVGGYTTSGELIVLKLDSNANTIFKKTFGTKNYDTLKTIIRLSDGGVLAVGTSMTSRDTHDPLFKTGLGLNDIYLTRFSKDGYKLWSKKYGTQHDDEGIDAAQAHDGSIIVLSSTMQEGQRDLTLMRIDENGNKIWLKQYADNNSIVPRKLLKLRNNNFLAALSYKDESNKEQIRLIKFDLRKNLLLDKKIYTTYASELLDIKEFSNGGIVGVGYVKDAFNTDALAMVLDSNLNMLYQQHYGDENYDILNSLVILENSQVAAAGLCTAKNSQESNMWILKLNRDATISQVASSANDIYNKLVHLFKDDIDANKIKIKRDLSIEFTDARLLFEVSKYELNKTQKIFLENFSNKLIPFLHRYQSQIDTLEVNGHTSSEWGDADFSQNFLKNEKLSMNRAYSTMSYMFSIQDEKLKRYLSGIFRGSGYGFSKKIMIDEHVEDKVRSRRVSFKIVLKTTVPYQEIWN